MYKYVFIKIKIIAKEIKKDTVKFVVLYIPESLFYKDLLLTNI